MIQSYNEMFPSPLVIFWFSFFLLPAYSLFFFTFPSILPVGGWERRVGFYAYPDLQHTLTLNLKVITSFCEDIEIGFVPNNIFQTYSIEILYNVGFAENCFLLGFHF